MGRYRHHRCGRCGHPQLVSIPLCGMGRYRRVPELLRPPGRQRFQSRSAVWVGTDWHPSCHARTSLSSPFVRPRFRPDGTAPCCDTNSHFVNLHTTSDTSPNPPPGAAASQLLRDGTGNVKWAAEPPVPSSRTGGRWTARFRATFVKLSRCVDLRPLYGASTETPPPARQWVKYARNLSPDSIARRNSRAWMCRYSRRLSDRLLRCGPRNADRLM